MSWDKRDGVHGGAHKNSWKELPFCRNDWWPHCNCSKNECKFYSKCFSFVKKYKQKVKNKKKILEKLADNEVYNI